jgi:hypothetical protein
MSDNGIRSFRIEITQVIAATGANRAGRPFCPANQGIPAQAGE